MAQATQHGHGRHGRAGLGRGWRDVAAGFALLVGLGAWWVGADPSDGTTGCVRSVDADAAVHATAAAAEAALRAALADAAAEVDAQRCTDWRVDVAGTFLLSEDLVWDTAVPLHLAGPIGATAVLQSAGSAQALAVTHRLLTVDTFPTIVQVTLERLLLLGGDVSSVVPTSGAGMPEDEGGAVVADDLRLIDVELRGNRAVAGGGVSTIDLHAVRTSFVSNTARSGVAEGGAVFALGDVTLENVTFTSNVADAGGAVWIDGTPGGADTLTATFVTFRDNRAAATGSGADLHVDATAGGLTVVLRGVVFGATATGPAPSCGGGYPFAQATRTATFGVDTSCGIAADDVTSPAPAFDRVAFRTGMTDLYAPQAGGPLVDAVACDATWPDVDQRGVVRPQGEDDRCDAGAVELVRAPDVEVEGETEVEVEVEVETEAEEEVPAQDADTTGPDGPDRSGGDAALPIPTSIPAGGGGCAVGCPELSVRAAGPAPPR
jgi:hypothetical protein